MLNNRNGNSIVWLTGLWVLLTSVQTVCSGQSESPAVDTILFGAIEPPVVAQKNITVLAPVSNQQTEPRPLECSSLAWFNNHLLIASDRHEHLIFTSSVNLNTMDIETPVPCVLVQNEQFLLSDIESMSVLQKGGQALLYMMCSMSNAPNAMPLPGRRQLLIGAIEQISPLTVSHSAILPTDSIRRQLEKCFEKINVHPYYTYDAGYSGQNKNTYRWANIEAISFTPNGQHLLCGMRNPLFDGAAMVFAVSGIPRPGQSFQQDSLKVVDFFLLELQERGISDLCWDPVTQGYLITAAKSNGPRLDPDVPFPPNTLDSALFWWSGQKADLPILIAVFPDMTIEAVCRMGTSRYIVLGSDEGDVSEGRTARQSMLTVMDFAGISK